MFSTSKLLTFATALAIVLLIAGVVIIATAMYYDSVNEQGTGDHIFFLGFGCFITSFLIAPTSRRHTY